MYKNIIKRKISQIDKKNLNLCLLRIETFGEPQFKICKERLYKDTQEGKNQTQIKQKNIQ